MSQRSSSFSFKSRNNNAENTSSRPICVPLELYFNNFFTSWVKGVSYSLVSVIYCFGVSIDVGHYNCTLFESEGKCLRFYDASVIEKLSHDVLLNEFTKDLRISWTENEEIL